MSGMRLAVSKAQPSQLDRLFLNAPAFTSANSDSDEWYADLTRIPDVIAGFDFNNSGSHTAKPAAQSVIGAYLRGGMSLQGIALLAAVLRNPLPSFIA